MKSFRVVFWLIPCAVAVGCGDSGNSSLEAFEAKVQALNAIPNDPDIVVHKAKCNTSATVFPLATMKYDNATFQGQGYRIACDDPAGFEALLNIMGTNTPSYSAMPVQSCEALAEQWNYQTSPTLDCMAAAQGNLLFRYLDGNVYKHFVNFRTFNDGIIFRMLGCTELMHALGFQAQDAKEIEPFYVDSELFRLDDAYDINCKNGTPIDAREGATCDSKPAKSTFVAPAGVDPQTGAFQQTWSASANNTFAWLPNKNDCQWKCDAPLVPVFNQTTNTYTCEICGPGDKQPGTTVCGPNDNGVYEQACSGNAWVDTQNCLDSDVCTNGMNERSCGGRYGNATQERQCAGGQWQGNWSACIDPDECVDGDNQFGPACGINDRGREKRSCQIVSGFRKWSDWACDGDIDRCWANTTQQIGVCGRNNLGKQFQDCAPNSSGVYDWGQSYCVHPDECSPGYQVDAPIRCNGGGYNNRTFVRTVCQTDASGVYRKVQTCIEPDLCVRDSIEPLPGTCGFYERGKRYKKCEWSNVNNRWEFGAEKCDDKDHCRLGTQRECGCNPADNPDPRTCFGLSDCVDSVDGTRWGPCNPEM